ncbi:Threonine--tRNA ligase, mitochondrial 1 [Vitis vinifera]|uniref:threonine--tRNA ligase n=1 Tax=Vitis vinifera TaxID=29760 RepID=A0A438EHK4_VITVI|nr:Threonine--tRNA ligase, mitochondrial 1 [Vitis vinifera]
MARIIWSLVFSLFGIPWLFLPQYRTPYWGGKVLLWEESVGKLGERPLYEYIARIEEAKKYDHRLLGVKQELFFCHPLSPGSWFFLPHGGRIYNKLMEFIKAQYKERGYHEVEKQEFGLKPMNCPGHCLMFEHRVRSYRELPLRLADFGVLHRNEASGALTGLTRVRRFQQDDAHIFCRESQIKDEVMGVLEFINYAYNIFGFTYELKLSTIIMHLLFKFLASRVIREAIDDYPRKTGLIACVNTKRPEKYLGDLETWEKAEAALTEALNQSGKPWEIDEGDGAFYGPKIDISVSDALSRKFQCATLQLDFQLPSRFDLSYSAEDEAKRERPVMIHRAILGSVERMFAILLEHYKGKWPFWLSPRQAIVCPVSEKSQPYALKVRDQIHQAGYYVDVDTTDRKIQKKVISNYCKYNSWKDREQAVKVTHLLFADDTIIFCEAKKEALLHLGWVLFWFEAASGLKINLDKSMVILVGEVDGVLDMAAEIGCRVGQLPTVYLGLPLGAPNRDVSAWDGVEERTRRRLSLWKRQYLSKGGRLTLIKSTMSSFPLYQMSVFRMPKSVARRIEKLQRDFLWGGANGGTKSHLVKWEAVCVEKEKGGLGLRKITSLNKALLGKWIWRFACAKEELWKKVLEAKYGKEEFGWRTRKANGALVLEFGRRS